MKVGNILNVNGALNNLAPQELDFKSSVAIYNNLQKLQNIIKTFTNKRDAMLDKYGKRDENNNLVQKADGIIINNVEDFTKEMNEILETDMDITLEKINFNSLEDVKISARDYSILAENELIQE